MPTKLKPRQQRVSQRNNTPIRIDKRILPDMDKFLNIISLKTKIRALETEIDRILDQYSPEHDLKLKTLSEELALTRQQLTTM